MTRFTHSILATALLLSATAVAAKDTGINRERMMAGTASGDMTIEFAYDQHQRLSSVESLASKVTFDYTPTTIDGENYDMTMRISDPSGDIVCYLEIGDNGFISKSREIEEVMGEQAPYKTYSFEYDMDGHLIKIDDNGFSGISTVTFEYSNGNIVSSAIAGSTTTAYTATYSTTAGENAIANKAGVMDFGAFGFDSPETKYLSYAGLLGSPTSDLPLSITMTRSNEIATANYTWHTNSEGFPTYRNIFNNNGYVGSNEYTWGNTAGITDISANRNLKSDGYYDIYGVRHSSPTRGINIATAQNGSIVKTMNR